MTPRESAQDFAALLRKLMATKLTASTAIALLEESADVIDGLVNELGDQDAGGPGNDELDGILTAMYLDVRRWVAANVLVPGFAPDPVAGGTAIPPMGAADSQCGEILHEVRRTWRCSADADHPLTWHVEHHGSGKPDRYWPVRTAPDAPDLAPAEALPMPAYDGDLCGWANPENLHRVCSAKDVHPEKWHAVHGAAGCVVEFWPAIPCACCEEFVAAEGEYCPRCVNRCERVRDRIAAEFPPATPALPWLCAECAAPTGIRCWSGFTHDRDVPVCVSHSVPTPYPGDDRECIGCANHRDDAAAVPASLALVQGLADGGAK